jgi:CRISPR system Cascade subunit CasC
MLQSFSATNLNRDDLNNPKDTLFGGARRARISSQCIKRAIRTHPLFEGTIRQRIEEYEVAPRTTYLSVKLEEALGAPGLPADDVKAVAELFPHALTGKLSKDKKTKVLLNIGWTEIQDIVKRLQDNETWPQIVAETRAFQADAEAPTPVILKTANAVLGTIESNPVAPDIALFGRMLAGKETFKREAACQVAQAVSTHAVKMDMDFYTAVDTIKETSGAEMMGYIGFNSACYYRYALLDWEQLLAKKNLGGDRELARVTVEAFLRAAEAATPTGKRTGFDNNSRPALMLAVARERHSPGWSLVNAFEKPVQAHNGSGLVVPSAARLNEQWNRLNEIYSDSSVKAVAVLLSSIDITPEMLKPRLARAIVPNLDNWIQTMLGTLPKE